MLPAQQHLMQGARAAGSNLVLDLLGKPVRRLVVTEDAPTFAVLVDFTMGPPAKPACRLPLPGCDMFSKQSTAYHSNSPKFGMPPRLDCHAACTTTCERRTRERWGSRPHLWHSARRMFLVAKSLCCRIFGGPCSWA